MKEGSLLDNHDSMDISHQLDLLIFLIGFAKILFITINNHHLIWYFLNISKHRGQANLRSMSNLTGHWAGPSLVFVRELRTSQPQKPSSFAKQNMGTTFNCSMFFVFFPGFPFQRLPTYFVDEFPRLLRWVQGVTSPIGGRGSAGGSLVVNMYAISAWMWPFTFHASK